MENQNILTGAVLLQTMWNTRQKDLLDLISPLVIYSIAKVTSPGEIIDQRRVLEIINSEFGYVDMPAIIIRRVMRRSDHFQKRDKEYFLKENLDSVVIEVDRRKEECEKKVKTIGTELGTYLETHLKSRSKVSTDAAIADLLGFFSRQGLFLGVNRLEEHADDLKGRESDYYIAQYLYEKKDANAIEYDYVIDLVKGYFLQSAIYLQGENGNLISSTYKNVKFYYDTPFLLKLLGYKTEEENNGAVNLHKALESQGGEFFYFPQTQNEIEGILYAYQKNIGKVSHYTLERLNEKHYTSSDVERLRCTWESRLQGTYHTNLAARPEYQTKSNGDVDVNYVIDENGLRDFLKRCIKWRSEDALNADLESVVSIHKLRGNIKSAEIERCKAVFVTTNTKLAYIVNQYYRENVNGQTFPLIITDSDLAALTWIKCGSVGDLPEKQLLLNAYMATQPAPELLEKFGQVLEKMESEGKITTEMAVAIRASGYTQKEILLASFEDKDKIDENLILEIECKLKEKFSSQAREDEKEKAKRKADQEHHDRLANADKSARKAAAQAKEKNLRWNRRIVSFIAIVVFVISIIGLVVSLFSSISDHLVLTIASFVLCILSVVSAEDTIKGKQKAIDALLVRRANQKYDKVYKQRSREYRAIADGNDL